MALQVFEILGRLGLDDGKLVEERIEAILVVCW